MLELGITSPVEHLRIAEMAQQITPQLVLVGQEFEQAAQQLGIQHFMEVPALRVWFLQQAYDHQLILVKGSRGIGLERLFDPA